MLAVGTSSAARERSRLWLADPPTGREYDAATGPGLTGVLRHQDISGGDSSGGNIAALACPRLRDEGGPLPAAQVLAFPNTDLTLSQPSAAKKA